MRGLQQPPCKNWDKIHSELPGICSLSNPYYTYHIWYEPKVDNASSFQNGSLKKTQAYFNIAHRSTACSVLSLLRDGRPASKANIENESKKRKRGCRVAQAAFFHRWRKEVTRDTRGLQWFWGTDFCQKMFLLHIFRGRCFF